MYEDREYQDAFREPLHIGFYKRESAHRLNFITREFHGFWIVQSPHTCMPIVIDEEEAREYMPIDIDEYMSYRVGRGGPLSDKEIAWIKERKKDLECMLMPGFMEDILEEIKREKEKQQVPQQKKKV